MNQRFTFALTAGALDRFSAAWKAFDRLCGDPVRPIPTLTIRSSTTNGTEAILAHGPYRFAASLHASAVHGCGTATLDYRPLEKTLSLTEAGKRLTLTFDPACNAVFLDNESHQRTVPLTGPNEPTPHRHAEELTRLPTPGLRAVLRKALPLLGLPNPDLQPLVIDRYPDNPNPEDVDGKPVAVLVATTTDSTLHHAVPTETAKHFRTALDPVLAHAFAAVHQADDIGVTRLASARDADGDTRTVLVSYQGHLSGPARQAPRPDLKPLHTARQQAFARCELDTERLLAVLQAFPASPDVTLEIGPDGLSLSQIPADGGLVAAAIARFDDSDDQVTWQIRVRAGLLRRLTAIFEGTETVLLTYSGPQSPITLSSAETPAATIAGVMPAANSDDPHPHPRS